MIKDIQAVLAAKKAIHRILRHQDTLSTLDPEALGQIQNSLETLKDSFLKDARLPSLKSVLQSQDFIEKDRHSKKKYSISDARKHKSLQTGFWDAQDVPENIRNAASGTVALSEGMQLPAAPETKKYLEIRHPDFTIDSMLKYLFYWNEQDQLVCIKADQENLYKTIYTTVLDLFSDSPEIPENRNIPKEYTTQLIGSTLMAELDGRARTYTQRQENIRRNLTSQSLPTSRELHLIGSILNEIRSYADAKSAVRAIFQTPIHKPLSEATEASLVGYLITTTPSDELIQSALDKLNTFAKTPFKVYSEDHLLIHLCLIDRTLATTNVEQNGLDFTEIVKITRGFDKKSDYARAYLQPILDQLVLDKAQYSLSQCRIALEEATRYWQPSSKHPRQDNGQINIQGDVQSRAEKHRLAYAKAAGLMASKALDPNAPTLLELSAVITPEQRELDFANYLWNLQRIHKTNKGLLLAGALTCLGAFAGTGVGVFFVLVVVLIAAAAYTTYQYRERKAALMIQHALEAKATPAIQQEPTAVPMIGPLPAETGANPEIAGRAQSPGFPD